jgi:hypothetical protein
MMFWAAVLMHDMFMSNVEPLCSLYGCSPCASGHALNTPPVSGALHVGVLFGMLPRLLCRLALSCLWALSCPCTWTEERDVDDALRGECRGL